MKGWFWSLGAVFWGVKECGSGDHFLVHELDEFRHLLANTSETYV